MVHVKKPRPIAAQGPFHIAGSVATNSAAKSLKPPARAIRSVAHGPGLGSFRRDRRHARRLLPVTRSCRPRPTCGLGTLNAIMRSLRCAVVHRFLSSDFGCSDPVPFAVRSFQPGPSCLQDMLPWLESCTSRVMHIGCVHHSRASTQPVRSAKKRGVS